MDQPEPRAPAVADLAGGASFRTIAVTMAVLLMGSTLPTPLYQLYRQRFGFSELILTAIYATYAVGNLLALLSLGRLSDQIGRRPVSLAFVGLGALATLVYLAAAGTGALFAARLVSGFAIGLAAGTGTAWLVDTDESPGSVQATLAVSVANFVGLALGPLLGGVLAQYAAWPLHLSYIVYLIMLAVMAALTARSRETVGHRAASLRETSPRPRLDLPPEVRLPFIAPAVAGFGAFALVGFYAALAPGLLAQVLHQTNRAVGGAVVAELFLVAAVAMVATRRTGSRAAMMSGLVLLLPSLALLVLSQALASFATLLVGTAVSGVAVALGYRGSLQVINGIAPGDRRAEVVSCYYVVTFLGNSLPVIGVGAVTALAGPMAAGLAFAATIAAFAVAALIAGRNFVPKG